jgi:hypothetical protein
MQKLLAGLALDYRPQKKKSRLEEKGKEVEDGEDL